MGTTAAPEALGPPPPVLGLVLPMRKFAAAEQPLLASATNNQALIICILGVKGLLQERRQERLGQLDELRLLGQRLGAHGSGHAVGELEVEARAAGDH